MKRLARSSLPRPSPPLLAACTDADPYDGEEVKSDDGKADSSALGVFLDAEFDGKLVTDSSWDDNADDPGPAALHGRSAQRHDRGRPRRQGRAHRTSRRRRSAARRRSRTPRSCRSSGASATRSRRRSTSSCRSTSRSAGQDAFATKYKDELRRLRRARRRLRLDVLLLPPEGTRAAPSPRPTSTTTTASLVAEPDARPPASSPSTTRSGRTARSTSSRSSASTRTARPRGDAGIDGYNEFVGAMKSELGAHNLTTIPATVPANPGVARARHRVQRDARRRQEDPRRRAAHRQRQQRPPGARVPRALRVAVDPRRLHRLQRPRRPRQQHPRARLGGQVGRRPVRRRVHERLRHVRVHRRLAVAGAQVDQPRRHDRLQVHRHRQQRHAGVLRVDGRRDDGDVPRLPRVRRPEDLRADLRATSTARRS